MGCFEPTLVTTSVGTHYSLVTRTSKCGWIISHMGLLKYVKILVSIAPFLETIAKWGPRHVDPDPNPHNIPHVLCKWGFTQRRSRCLLSKLMCLILVWSFRLGFLAPPTCINGSFAWQCWHGWWVDRGISDKRLYDEGSMHQCIWILQCQRASHELEEGAILPLMYCSTCVFFPLFWRIILISHF